MDGQAGVEGVVVQDVYPARTVDRLVHLAGASDIAVPTPLGAIGGDCGSVLCHVYFSSGVRSSRPAHPLYGRVLGELMEGPPVCNKLTGGEETERSCGGPRGHNEQPRGWETDSDGEPVGCNLV